MMKSAVLFMVVVAVLSQLSAAVPVPEEEVDVPPPTRHTGRMLKEVVFDPEDQQLPWQKSGHFEGDIMLNESFSRNGLINTGYRWSNRIMPYYIDPVFSTAQRNIILSAINEYNSRTCVRMRPYQNGDRDYIWIKGANSGCWSYVGRQGGGQDVNLQLNGCVHKGTAIHEFLHAWGFFHQQSASERDSFVSIQWNNIQTGMEHNFDKYSASYVTSFGQTYDYSSVMHYDAYAFSKNGQPTIIPLQNAQIGQIQGFSNLDIRKLNAMYGCYHKTCSTCTKWVKRRET